MKNIYKALIVLMGLPASGKSTVAQLLATELTKQCGLAIHVIGTDDVRQKLDHFDPDLEPFIKDETLSKIQGFLKEDIIVINDDMNYFKSMRHELKQIAHANQAHFVLIHIATPLETALTWNEDRGFPIPQGVIQRVHKKFDQPGTYTWDNPLLTIHPEETSPTSAVAEIVTKILPILESPIPQPTTSQISPPNLSEKADLLTRRIVSTFAQNERNPAILKKISKFRINYLKTLQLSELMLEKLEEEFTHALIQYLSRIRPAT
jgi:tRNA uridine 5-carbamoylmethylation protein Kti12